MNCRYCGTPAESGVCEDHELVDLARTHPETEADYTMTFSAYEWELLCMSLCHWRTPDMHPGLSHDLDQLCETICLADPD